MDASLIGPAALHRSTSSATPARALWLSARVSGVISSETLSRARARLLSGSEMTQRIQFDPNGEKLPAQRSFSWKPFLRISALRAFAAIPSGLWGVRHRSIRHRISDPVHPYLDQSVVRCASQAVAGYSEIAGNPFRAGGVTNG
jgi:hypothetical protein